MTLARGAMPESVMLLPRKVVVRVLPAVVPAVCEPWLLVSPEPGSSAMFAVPQRLAGAPQTKS